MIRSLRGDVATTMDTFGDAGTGHFSTGLMDEHETMADS
jgi:hypothetical protein